MNNRALLSALAVCFAVAGCDSKQTAEPPKTKPSAAVVPLPPPAPTAPAASAGQDARPSQVVDAKAGSTNAAAPPKGRRGCGSGRCVVKITVDDSVTPCKITYSTDKLSIYGPNVVRWTVSGGWLFDTNGIVVATGGNQFSDPRGDGTATYSWKDANTDKNDYKYSVNLKKGTTKTCKGDPSMVNGADYEDPNYP